MAKKYHNIHDDFMSLRDQFRIDPITGNDALGGEVYKVRMPISDKNKGQSAGARVIIKVYNDRKIVYVLSVFDKSVSENIVVKALNVFRKMKFFFILLR